MAESGIFERLASGLSLDERQNLLEKLRSQSNISNEPLYSKDKETVSAADADARFPALPWYYRLWYFFLSFFKAKSPVEIFEDHQISYLGQMIEERSPGLYDYQHRLLLPAFHRHMEKLKEASRFFYSALDTGVSRDKGAFFAFLGSLEMGNIHKILQEETDPGVVTEKHPGTQDTELRQMAFRAMEDAFAMITDEQRNTMYYDARSLNCLKGISSFLYDRVIMAFNFSAAHNGPVCSVNVVRELLMTLNNALFTFSIVPPLPLLESLFVFTLQDRAGEQGFDINREIRLLSAKAEDALGQLREFNRQVPLTWIIRCATRDMTLSPRETSGGEDWFVIYRDYWKRHIDFLFGDYLKDRRRLELINSFRYFLKGHSLKVLENVESEANPDGLPIKGAFALSFLYTFYSAVFMPETNKILRPILIDGEFHENEHRAEFAESYNNLIKLEDDIKRFEYAISPSGDFGKRYAQARHDMSALQVKRRKIQIVLEEVQEDAEKIVHQVRSACRRIVNILGGVRGRDFKIKYEVITNFSSLTAKNSQFAEGIDESILQLRKVTELLDDIEAMEDGR